MEFLASFMAACICGALAAVLYNNYKNRELRDEIKNEETTLETVFARLQKESIF